MLDRVREAVFSTLGGRVEGARVLDLFAGTGALSLEALSRGAASARLIERDPRVIKLLRENVATLGLGERATVVPGDAIAPRQWGSEGERYGIVFFDSPYPMLDSGPLRHAVLDSLRKLVAERLDEGGVAVFHAPAGKVQAQELGPGVSVRVREYGTNAILYLERAG